MIEAKARFRFTLPGFEDGMDMADYLSSFTEKEIADLFDLDINYVQKILAANN